MARRIAVLMSLVLLWDCAFSQDIKTIALVVPFSTGSAQDIYARMLSDPLAQELGARVLVVNKPGAGGALGAAYVAQAKPDGQTYLLASSGHHLAGALSHQLSHQLSYHPLESFSGAAFTGYSEYVLIAAGDLNVPDLAAFINVIKTHPQTYNFASSGRGSTTHVGMAAFLERAGLQMVHLPLKGTNEVINEVISGRVQAAMVSALSIQPFKTDPRIKLLATTGPQRSEYFPKLPTISEFGFGKFKWIAWTGLLAPLGTPEGSLQNMNHAVSKVLKDPQMKSRFGQLGVSPSTMSNQDFNKFLREDWTHSVAWVSQLKITLD